MKQSKAMSCGMGRARYLHERMKLRALAASAAQLRGELAQMWAEWQTWHYGWPPGHFYSPIPDREAIRQDEARVFAPPEQIRGVELNAAGQLRLLAALAPYYAELPFTDIKQPGLRYFFDNPNYSYGDAIVLFTMLRHLRPRRVVEVGSGYSSCLLLDTNELFFNNAIECTFIEPYPELLLSLAAAHDRLQIIPSNLQSVDPAVFTKLEAGDILFIDSTHVSKIGSDVHTLFFEILPILQKGVYVHIHDIFYPFEYPKAWIYEGRAWNEAYLLRAFLQYNDVFEIQLFNAFVAEYQREFIEQHMPAMLKPCGPGISGIWLKKMFATA